jgi:thioredoxin reductase (NADPH)
MSSIPMPDERTIYSSHRQDDVDALAWPVFSEHALGMLRSAGEVLHPRPGELLWDAGDPYDLNLVLGGGVLLLDRRDDRVVFVIEEGDFVGELGMLMGQRAFPEWPWRGPRCSGCGSRSFASSWRSRGS